MEAVTNVRVLVVDDDAAMRALLRTLLRRHGAAVVGEAACGEEAVRLLGRDGIDADLAIVDFNMPGIDGLECVRRLRAIAPGQRAVLFTGGAADELRERAAADDVEVVAKLDLPRLLDRLHEVAGRGGGR